MATYLDLTNALGYIVETPCPARCLSFDFVGKDQNIIQNTNQKEIKAALQINQHNQTINQMIQIINQNNKIENQNNQIPYKGLN